MFYVGSYRPHPSAVGEEYGPLVHKGPSKGLIESMNPQPPGHPHTHTHTHTQTHTSSLHHVLMDVGQDPVVILRYEIRVRLTWAGG